jgi:hypothetical protein
LAFARASSALTPALIVESQQVAVKCVHACFAAAQSGRSMALLMEVDPEPGTPGTT